jgi:hypothetical protein
VLGIDATWFYKIQGIQEANIALRCTYWGLSGESYSWALVLSFHSL